MIKKATMKATMPKKAAQMTKTTMVKPKPKSSAKKSKGGRTY